jgi:hypothetical protein
LFFRTLIHDSIYSPNILETRSLDESTIFLDDLSNPYPLSAPFVLSDTERIANESSFIQRNLSAPLLQIVYIYFLTRILFPQSYDVRVGLEDIDRTFQILGHLSSTPSRTFFQTVKGRIGMGPVGIQMGDQIHIIRGGPTPFILRPIEEKANSLKNYKLIGNCYVDGIMDGELFSGGRFSGSSRRGNMWRDAFLR